MTDVFISYNRHDQTYARKLADDMRRRGLDVWIDDRIGHGDHWFDEIEQAISGSRAVVVIMTSEAEQSEWVKKEILIAKREGKPIYPVLLQGREFGILIDLQFANVVGGRLPPDDFYARLAGSTSVAALPSRSNRLGRTAGMAVATLAVVAVGVFFLVSLGLIPRFEAGALPTATYPPPTFPSLDGMPSIDIGQIDPNAFPVLSPVPFGGSLMPPMVEKGATPVLWVQETGVVAQYLALVARNQLDDADQYVCPAQQGSLTQSLRRLMTERNVADVVSVACTPSSTGANNFTCDYTLVLTDGLRVPQTDTFHLENALIC